MSIVLVLNSGSSSMKFQVIDMGSERPIAVGLAERIGQPAGRLEVETGAGQRGWDGRIPDHADALQRARQLLAAAGVDLTSDLVAVGHRVVHGGASFSAPVIVDDHVLDEIRRLSVLAPLHNPANVTGIEQARAIFAGVPQVAVFDTGFFADLPAAAATYAIDRDIAATQHIRRYGFHGTSHQYVSARVSKLLGRHDLRQIVLHLGNGASVSAVTSGRAVETSMGLTPLEGLVMGTRSGDVDPGLLLHLHRALGMSFDDIDDLLNRRSGMLGLAGASDLRDVHKAVDAGDRQARLALDVYCHRIRKYIGGYAAVLGGLDAVTFTAGVGENDAVLRAAVVEGLGFLGISVDPVRNAVRSPEPRVISPDDAQVTVLVVPTNEELAIARATLAVVG
jgi:acetate kinase